MEDKKNMAPKNERIKELAEQLIELVSEADECKTNSADPGTKTTEEMKELANRDDYIGTIARVLLKIMEDLDEIKERQNTYYPLSPGSPGIKPYEPYEPYTPYPSPSVPWPPQVWYTHVGNTPSLDPSMPVTCTYCDTEGNYIECCYKRK